MDKINEQNMLNSQKTLKLKRDVLHRKINKNVEKNLLRRIRLYRQQSPRSKPAFLAYGSVATSDDEAKQFVEYLIPKYNIQNGELKGGRLVNSNRGRQAVDEVLTTFSGRFKVSLHNKRYVLATKFFEYIFEPCISEINSLFYNINFHKFISNYLYMEFLTKDVIAEEVFVNFENMMRNIDDDTINPSLNFINRQEISDILRTILEFAILNKTKIREELDGLPGDGLGKWILDLTNTSLFCSLTNWGEEFNQINAICDPAAPLSHDQTIFDAMINRPDKQYANMGGVERPITFNLSGPIEQHDSKIKHGIQIADVIAAASIYALTKDDAIANKWKPIIANSIIYESVMPDFEHLDLQSSEARINTLILLELHNRSKNNHSLTENMKEFVQNTMIADRLGFFR